MSDLPPEIDSGDGRRFGLTLMDPGSMLDLIEAAGSAADSSAWLRYAQVICTVSAIDGKPVMMPNTKQQVRELGRRIGNVGFASVAAVVLGGSAAEPVAEDVAAKN